MKKVNFSFIAGIVCTSIILNMINLSFALDNEMTGKRQHRSDSYTHPGYKPVLDECPDIEDAEKMHDNFLYKEWCKKTFSNGNHIYEGYKDIAFNIKYTAETTKTDNWQTPLETIQLEQGDCEDAVFLFFSHLPPNQQNAEIVWGWVIDRQQGVARAHVWYQLRDREGKQYVVEGFSNDWNGIIPMEIMKEKETRKPIHKITHPDANRLFDLISQPDSWNAYQTMVDLYKSTDNARIEDRGKIVSQNKVTHYHLNMKHTGIKGMSRKYKVLWSRPASHRMNTLVNKEISKIYKKLYQLFTRYEKQKKSSTNLQFAYRNINNYRRNLNCRR